MKNKTFKVEVKTILQKTIEVEARTISAAEQKVLDRIVKGEITLNFPEDIKTLCFTAEEKTGGERLEKRTLENSNA